MMNVRKESKILSIWVALVGILTLCAFVIGPWALPVPLDVMAQSYPSQIGLSVGTPAQASNGNAFIGAGQPGNTTYFYWIVSVYGIGETQPYGPIGIYNAPNSLTVSNYVTVSWFGSPGATSYKVIRTTTQSFPGSCASCLLTTTSSTLINDTGSALTAYTPNTAGGATAILTLNNKTYPQARLQWDTPFNNITTYAVTFGDGTVQTTAATGGGGGTSFNTGLGLQLTGSVAPYTLGIIPTVVKQYATTNTVTAASYAITDADRGGDFSFTNAGAVAVSLPAPVAGPPATFVSGWAATYQCLGCGGITITCTGCTINQTGTPGATATITANTFCNLISDGSNYKAECSNGATGPIGPTGPVSNSGSLVNNNLVQGAGATSIKDTGVATSDLVLLNIDNTLGAHVWDATGTSRSAPMKSGTVGSLPGTCTVGDEYFATNAVAGRNIYLCAATNTWTQNAYTANTNLSLSSSNVLSFNPFDTTVAWWYDDFNYGTLTTAGGLSAIGWSVDKLATNACAAGGGVSGSSGNNHPGSVSFSSSATANTDGCSMNLNNAVQSGSTVFANDISSTGNGNWEMRGIVFTNSSVASQGLAFGWSSGAAAYRGTHFILVRYDTSGLTCTGTGNGDTTHWVFEVDSTCVASAVTVNLSTWYWMRIVSSGGNVSMDVSTSPTFSGPTSVAAAPAAAMVPVFQVQNRTTASVKLFVDYFGLQFTGLTR